jgi:hypothetical protein
MRNFISNIIFSSILLGGSSIFLSLFLGIVDLKINPFLVFSTILSLVLITFCTKFNSTKLYSVFLCIFIYIVAIFQADSELSTGFYLILISTLFILLSLDLTFKNFIFFEKIYFLVIFITIFGYIEYRVYDEVSEKTGNANSNFIGAISILLLFHIFINKLNDRSSILFIFCFIVSLLGVFFSSSRFAILFTFLLISIFFIINFKFYNFLLLFSILFSILFIIFLFNGFIGNQLIDEQFFHIISRMMNEDLFSDNRSNQLNFVFNVVYNNPLFFFLPIDVKLTENILGVGFSDNSFLEISSYIGLLLSLLLSVIIFKRINKLFGNFYMFFFVFLYFSFNIIIWLPFIFLFVASGIIYKHIIINSYKHLN